MRSVILLLRQLRNMPSRWLGQAGAARKTTSRVMTVTRKPSVVRYVDALLLRLAEQRLEMTLSASDPLPELEGSREDLPSFEQVVNRLKVLSGLNPVTNSRTVSGRFTHWQRGRWYDVVTHFDDRGIPPSCRVSLSYQEKGTP